MRRRRHEVVTSTPWHRVVGVLALLFALVVALGGLSVACRASAAEEAEKGAERLLDLERVVHLALARNAALRAEAERRQEVLAGVDEAAADAWPQVDIVSSWSRARSPALLNSPDFSEFVDQFPDFEPQEEELWSAGVRVTQPLYTGGKVSAAIELAELVVGVTDAQIESVRLDTALAAATSYFRLLAHRAALGTVESQAAARRGALEVVEARYELGEATRLELLRAQAALAEVAPSEAEIRGRIVAEESRLRALLGFDAGEPLELRARSEAPVAEGETMSSAPRVELSRLLAVAADERPELRDLELQIRALEEQRTVEVAEGRPQVDFAGSYGRQARLPENLDDSLFDDWRATVAMTWNVFDGGRRDGVVAQIESRRDQTRWRLEELRRQIDAEIRSAHASLATARAREEAARLAADAAREAERVAGESYRLGVALQADLLDAQDLAIRTRLALTEATLERRLQASRLRRAVGLLPTAPLPIATRAEDDRP